MSEQQSLSEQTPPIQGAQQPPLQEPKPKRSGRISAKTIVLLCAALVLIAAGVGYTAWTAHQRTLERQRRAAEKARLAEIDRNVEIFRKDMQELLEGTSGMLKTTADGEVGRFELFFQLKLTNYLISCNEHSDTIVKFHDETNSVAAIANDDRDFSKSNANLVAMRAESAQFYSKVQGIFAEKSFRDWFATSDIPASAQDKMLKIMLPFCNNFTTTITQAQQSENGAWDAEQRTLDLLKEQYGNWKIEGDTVVWYSKVGYDLFDQIDNEQVDFHDKATDALWHAVSPQG